jgi:hypothetical protein
MINQFDVPTSEMVNCASNATNIPNQDQITGLNPKEGPGKLVSSEAPSSAHVSS